MFHTLTCFCSRDDKLVLFLSAILESPSAMLAELAPTPITPPPPDNILVTPLMLSAVSLPGGPLPAVVAALVPLEVTILALEERVMQVTGVEACFMDMTAGRGEI